jgi:hypothetical protein
MRHRLIASIPVIGLAPGLAGRQGMCDHDTGNCLELALLSAPIGVPIVVVASAIREPSPQPSTATAAPHDTPDERSYRLAAEKGDAQAQCNLGLLYSQRNIPQDDIVADMWFALAATGGNHDAARDRGLIEKRMTPAQIAEVKKLASEWKPVGARITAPPEASTTPTTGVSPPTAPTLTGPASSHPRIGPV